MKKWIKIMLVVVLVAVAVIAVVKLTAPSESSGYKTQEARIKNISRMVELCTADIHEELAVKDSINGMWIVARQTIEGRIRFDLDGFHTENRGDTIIVYLPKERVDIFEGDSPGAYEVFDSWDGRNLIFPRTLTASEENRLKTRWQKRARERIYQRGYVKAARENAVKSLTPIFNAMRGPEGTAAPVIIIDPTPQGNP